jgi:hypothetical protein
VSGRATRKNLFVSKTARCGQSNSLEIYSTLRSGGSSDVPFRQTNGQTSNQTRLWIRELHFVCEQNWSNDLLPESHLVTSNLVRIRV